LSGDSARQFSSARYIALETYKKNGQPVQTPVWVLEDGGTVYVRTDPGSWKAKRIRRNPHVRLATSDMRGKPTGPWVEGEAHFVEGGDADRILKLITKKYGLGGEILEFFNRLRGANPTGVISIKVG